MNAADPALHDALVAALARHQVPGASVARFRQGAWSVAAAGMANVATGVEMDARTLVHIGSIAKILNATLVMQLVDEGLLDLDDGILQYLPPLDWKEPQAAAAITVRMLLNHTSGINGELLPDHGPDEETVEKGVQRWARLGQLFTPGSQFSYCNAGVSLSGYIVQRIRSKSWYSLVMERIFEPLDMRHAISIPQEAMLHRVAVGHYLQATDPPQLVRTSRALLPVSFGPGGATLMMSASDLIRFAHVHMNQGVGMNGARILSPRSVAAMQTLTVDNEGNGYTQFDLGLGWMLSKDGLLAHTGGAPGVTSALFVQPAQQFAMAVLTNAEHGMALVRELVRPELEGLTQAPAWGLRRPDGPPAAPPRPLGAYVGRFDDQLIEYSVSIEAGRLMLARRYKFAFYDSVATEASAPAPLESFGEDRFVWRASADVAGVDNANGRAFAFREAGADGRMGLLCNNLRTYRRCSPA